MSDSKSLTHSSRYRNSPKGNKQRVGPFGIWRHNVKSLIYASPLNIMPKKIDTEIGVGVVAVSLFKLERNMKWSGLELSSRHYCWTDMKNRDPASISDLVSFQIAHNLIPLIGDNCHRLTDPSPTRLLTQIKKLAIYPPTTRCLFLYNGHGSPEPISSLGIMLFPDEDLGGDQVTGRQLLAAMPIPSCWIFDADYSGLVAKDFEDASLICDRFGFFSCGPTETLPHRIGLPSDLFTSCMLTPSYVAMLWGSRQFYAFTDGSLHEFPLGYFSDENGVRPHLVAFTSEIEKLMITLVRAMAFSIIPMKLLYDCFFRDEKVGHLFVNFCLARRIGQELNYHPESYPQIPDLSRHPLWEFFDLYLDRVLLRLAQSDRSSSVSPQQIAIEFSGFLGDALIAIEHSLQLLVFDTIPNEFALLPLILADRQYAHRAVTALIKFIDIGENAQKAVIGYGIVPALVDIDLSEGDILLEAGYCVAVCSAFAVTSDYVMRSFLGDTSGIIAPLMTQFELMERPVYAIIPLVIFCANLAMERPIPVLRKEREIQRIAVRSIRNEDEADVVKFWSLLFFSTLFGSRDGAAVREITASTELLKALECVRTSPACEIRAVVVQIYARLVEALEGEDQKLKIIQIVHNLYINDPSAAVRMQVLLTAKSYLETSHDRESLSVRGYVADKIVFRYTIDPSKEIADIASALTSFVGSEGMSSPMGFTSSLFAVSMIGAITGTYGRAVEGDFAPFVKRYPREPLKGLAPVDPAGEFRIAELDHFSNGRPVTTNLLHLRDSFVVFGDDRGGLVVRNYAERRVEKEVPWQAFFNHHMDRPVDWIGGVQDGSVVVATRHGDVALVTDLMSTEIAVAETFTYPVVTSEWVRFHYSRQDESLFATTKPDSVQQWIIPGCRLMPEIVVGDGPINAITTRGDEPNSLVVGCDSFRVIDLRSPADPFFIPTGAPIVGVAQYATQANAFAALASGGIGYEIDLRMPSILCYLKIPKGTAMAAAPWADLIALSGQPVQIFDIRAKRCLPLSGLSSAAQKEAKKAEFAFGRPVFSYQVGAKDIYTMCV